ncbi:MAG: UTP--glucose-1-phosphate uridylyltransferase GalU [Xanthomonadales bacterium]|nr:UTP--glucose-1-phosphate uridylyltransferase GalU [Xanthomonadales bacterium]
MKPALRKVVFPVAGLGTRFLPATKVVPKELLPIVDRPLIQWAVDEAVAAGADTLVFVINRNKRAIADHFDVAYELEDTLVRREKHDLLRVAREVLPAGVETVYVVQQQALGLGHAVLCARPVVGNEDFGVILPDDFIFDRQTPALAQMAKVHAEHGGAVVAVEPVDPEWTSRYGIVGGQNLSADLVKVSEIVEKPAPADAPSNLGVVGRYVLPGRIFELLASTQPGAGGEIQLTDAIAALIAEQPVHGYRFSGRRFDCGNKLGFVEATVAMAMEDPATAQALRASLPAIIDGS